MKSKIFNIFLTIFLAMKKYDSKLEKICSKSNKLENKDRNDNGFGSTGV